MADSDVLNARNGDCCNATHTPATTPGNVEPNAQAYLDWLRNCKNEQAQQIAALGESGDTENTDTTTRVRCDGADVVIEDVLDGEVVADDKFTSLLRIGQVAHGAQAFQNAPDADWRVVSTFTVTNDSAKSKRAFVIETSGVNMVNTTTVDHSTGIRRVGDTTVSGGGLGPMLYDVDLVGIIDEHGQVGIYQPLIPANSSVTFEWVKRFDQLAGGNARDSASRLDFIIPEMCCI